ncbi:gastrula zinc finger protein XlCGF67.1-like [Chrysoperla carnea]|uniref:gastrula zinc finger protein XlCGF67.1-like n=1 Tax=Chrysoperla carnea TaxID=189513 RepID=UPI001D0750A7|nr:gastrula zinc finger protein XlCGF67.1-like [Chrysoperla carnea]
MEYTSFISEENIILEKKLKTEENEQVKPEFIKEEPIEDGSSSAETIKYRKRGHLNVHKRIHPGAERFSCADCGKTFTEQRYLNSHKRRHHTGEKPFSCKVCEKTFTEQRYLNSHKRLHTGEKRFSRKVCGKEFNWEICSNAHKRIHAGEKVGFP